METLRKRATSVAHLTNFFFEFFYANFTQDAPLLYTMMQNVKNDQKLKSRGSCKVHNAAMQVCEGVSAYCLDRTF